MLIRDATQADVEAMAAIYDEQVRSSVATFDVEPVGATVLGARIAAAHGSHHVLVAELDVRVMGYAHSGSFRPRPAYDGTTEVSVYLHAEARRRGVATALYTELFARLDADTRVHTQLAVVALPNDPSEALHRRFGFTEVGTLREVGHKLGRWVDVRYLQRMSP